ncbi:MAG: mannan-binding protein [Thiolinea sp.]
MNKSSLMTAVLAGSLMVAAMNPALAETKAVEAGPIWSQSDAQKKCPALAKAKKARWTGHWWTTVQGKMSVCQLDYSVRAMNAGPIWNQNDAKGKCPALAQRYKARWTGHWWTTVQGKMSVCQLDFSQP